MFHLFTHAFFKALLFLGSGSVILAMHHEQDIRHMGGLWRKIPFTYGVMLIGTLGADRVSRSPPAISPRTPSSRPPPSAPIRWRAYGFLMTVGAAALTSFYSWRLIFKTFHGEPHDRHHYEAAHESPKVMLIPLARLGVRLDRRRLAVSLDLHRPRRRANFSATRSSSRPPTRCSRMPRSCRSICRCRRP